MVGQETDGVPGAQGPAAPKVSRAGAFVPATLDQGLIRVFGKTGQIVVDGMHELVHRHPPDFRGVLFDAAER